VIGDNVTPPNDILIPLTRCDTRTIRCWSLAADSSQTEAPQRSSPGRGLPADRLYSPACRVAALGSAVVLVLAEAGGELAAVAELTWLGLASGLRWSMGWRPIDSHAVSTAAVVELLAPVAFGERPWSSSRPGSSRATMAWSSWRPWSAGGARRGRGCGRVRGPGPAGAIAAVAVAELAERRDNGKMLLDETPLGLRDKIIADYIARKVPRSVSWPPGRRAPPARPAPAPRGPQPGPPRPAPGGRPSAASTSRGNRATSSSPLWWQTVTQPIASPRSQLDKRKHLAIARARQLVRVRRGPPGRRGVADVLVQVLSNAGGGVTELVGHVLTSKPASSASVAAVCRAAWNLMTGSPAALASSRNRRETYSDDRSDRRTRASSRVARSIAECGPVDQCHRIDQRLDGHRGATRQQLAGLGEVYVDDTNAVRAWDGIFTEVGG
jgi:hypothetical protein